MTPIGTANGKISRPTRNSKRKLAILFYWERHAEFQTQTTKTEMEKYKVGSDIRLNSHRGSVTFVQAIDTTIEPSFGKFCHKRYTCKIYESILMQSRVLLLT